MKTLFLFATLLVSSISLAQISHGGAPFNWAESNVNELTFEQFDAGDISRFESEDAVLDTYKNIPFRFGANMETDLSSETHGVWTTLENGNRIWRLGIASRNAVSLNFEMDVYQMPIGGALFVYSSDKKQLLGSFTHENTSPINSLGVGMVFGEQIVLEYIEPAEVSGQGYFHINQVTHGYRNFMHRIGEEKAGPFGTGGDCHINVNCPEGLLYDIQKRSVAVIVRNGNGICTGALVNNTAEDAAPLFLTANHCLPFNNDQLNNWIFYFNHQTADCAGTIAAPVNQSVSGANLLANHDESDFALLELQSNVPASYNPCFSGWDASDLETAVVSAYTIHHPSGDVKKITFENDAPYHTELGGFVNQVWYVDNWDMGATESGSSGAPFFNQSGLIIGQLAGGLSDCDGDVSNGLFDYFGRFGVSWDFGDSPSNTLKPWLDPTDSGQLVMPNSCNNNIAENDILLSKFENIKSTYCYNAAIQPEITVVNSGTANITSFGYIVTVNGGIPEYVVVDNLDIPTLQTATIDINPIALQIGNNTIHIEVVVVNEQDDENEFGNELTGSTIYYATGEPVTIAIQFDDYPNETTWRIEDGAGQIIIDGNGYLNTDTEIEVSTCLGDGCFNFIIEDSFGDGICCANGEGSYQVIGQNGGLYIDGGSFGYEETAQFCTFVTNIDNPTLLSEIDIYPNPGTDEINLSMGALTSKVENINIVDAVGRSVYSTFDRTLFEQSAFKINTSTLSSGIYFVTFQTKQNGLLTKRLILTN